MMHKGHAHRLRTGRVSQAGQIYLVTTVTKQRRKIFRSLRASRTLIGVLREEETLNRARTLAFVVMPDHLHFVAGLKQGSIAQIMRSLKSYTAKEINLLLDREGAFWQPQYHDHAVRKDEDLNEVVLYTLQNPVRAGLVKDFHDYPYWYCRWDV